MEDSPFKQYDRVLVRFHDWQPWWPAIFDKMKDGKPHFFIGSKSYHYPQSIPFDENLAEKVTA